MTSLFSVSVGSPLFYSQESRKLFTKIESGSNLLLLTESNYFLIVFFDNVQLFLLVGQYEITLLDLIRVAIS